MAIAEAEYFGQRLDYQVNWNDSKSGSNQRRGKRLRLAEIVFASAIPLLAGYSQISGTVGMTIGFAIGIIGLIVAVLAGVMSLYRLQGNWNEYRANSESLKQEKYLYLARVEPYDGEQPFELLVQRVKGLFNIETAGLAQAMHASGAAGKAGRGHTTEPRP